MKRFRNLIGKVPTGLLSVLTVLLILWLTLAPHPTGEIEIPLFPGADKVVHLLMFAFLTCIVLLETMKHSSWKPLSLVKIAFIAFGCAIFGFVIELVQHLMGLGRSFEVLDILADSAGAFGGAGLWAMFQNILADTDQ